MKKNKFEQIYDTYYDSVYRYIFVCVKDKWNAEDIIATVFVKVYENIDKLEAVEDCKQWIFRVAHNAVIDFYRKNAKVVPIEDFMDRGEEDISYDNILTKDEYSGVKKFLDQLPKETKDMIYMRFYGGLKYKEIGDIVNKTDNTVKTIISRALKKIKSGYEEAFGGKVYEGK